jgi:ribonuclease D
LPGAPNSGSKFNATVDLAQQFEQTKGYSRCIGLDKLVRYELQWQMDDETFRIAKSDWGAEKLSKEQCRYAALDAILPLLLLTKLKAA